MKRNRTCETAESTFRTILDDNKCMIYVIKGLSLPSLRDFSTIKPQFHGWSDQPRPFHVKYAYHHAAGIGYTDKNKNNN
jgi:hypothetical protein